MTKNSISRPPRKESRITAILSQMLLPTVLYAAYNVLVVEVWTLQGLHGIAFAPVGAVGTALAIFLAFRNNSSYDRWWEARKFWGSLINASRTWARRISHHAPTLPSRKHQFIARQAAFAYALASHLLKIDDFTDAERLLPTDELTHFREADHKPYWILRRQAECIEIEGMSELTMLAFHGTLDEFTSILGGCERIKNTPLPSEYDFFTRFFVYCYGALLPFGLLDSTGLSTAPISICIWLLFAVLERIGFNLEDPFEISVHDIPMGELAGVIERDLTAVVSDLFAREATVVDGGSR